MSNKDQINGIRGVLILFVVIGHFMQYIAKCLPEGMSYFANGIVLLIYSFHMPLFVGISGYLSTNLEKRRMTAFETLLIPYLFFQIVFGVVRGDVGGVIHNAFLLPQFGLWYLLALFFWRLLIKDLVCIKGVFGLSVILNILTPFFTGIGKVMALQRVVGFLIFFLAGYYISERAIVINRKRKIWIISLPVFAIEYFGFSIASKQGYYDLLIDIMCHRILYTGFSNALIPVMAYTMALVVVSINAYLFIGLCDKIGVALRKPGKDTLPIYISHLVLYLIIVRFGGHFELNGVLGLAVGVACIIVSMVLFSNDKYRELFHATVSCVSKLIKKSEN